MAGTRERLRLIFCLSDPARPAPSGIVASQPWGMRATLLPGRPVRPPSKAGPAQGARATDVTIRGSPTPAPNSRHLPGESPQRIAISLVVAWLPHQADARTGGNAMRWIYDACGNADLEEVAFAERGRLGDTGARRPLLRPEGRCGRRDVRGHCEGLSSPQGLRGPHGRQLVLRLRGRADSGHGRRRDSADSRHRGWLPPHRNGR